MPRPLSPDRMSAISRSSALLWLAVTFVDVGSSSFILSAQEEPVPAGPAVLNGIDVLQKQNIEPLKDRRIGLVTNHTKINRGRKATIDLLRAAPNVKLKALF